MPLFSKIVVATAVVIVFAGNTPAEANSRFSSSQETGGAPGRYRVELDLRPGDDLVAVSSQLAATYGARIEPYAEDGFSGFAIIATPVRARLMSSDPRVVAITDLSPAVSTDAQPAESSVIAKAAPPTVAVEQQGRGIATEAVPGFGSYLYDPSGNITSIDTQTFRYDAFSRLQTADLGSFGTRAYTYDRYGNILTVVTDGDEVNAVRMSVDPETNQMDLPFSQSNPANMIATYDGVGNVITHNGTFVYDALNMMKETTDTTRRLHVYSASDERVAVIEVANGVEASSEWTLRDGSHRILRRLTKDTGGVWHWKEDYIYGGSRLLAAEVTGSERVRHFHLDHLGTPRLITGNGGVRIAEKTYEPFGKKLSSATNDFEQLEFTGHERDTPALDYMHARYYQPDLRRFLSVDPKERRKASKNSQEWNLYAYALNNPVKYVDPDGKDAEIAAGSNVTAIKAYLTELARRPSGRAQLMAVVNDRNFKLRITSGALTPPALLVRSAQQRTPITATFGEVVPTGNVQQPAPGAPGQYVVTGGTMTFDPNAISRAHPDRTGTTTAAHEFHHANALQTGGVPAAQAGDHPTSATGPAEQHGQQVAAEMPDLSRRDARALIDQVIPVRP